MKVFLSSLILIFSFTSSAASIVDCNYNFFGAPFASMQLTYDDAGNIGPEAKINFYGKNTIESVTPIAKAAGEIEHFLLSKELSDDPIQVIIYAEATQQGNSQMINPQAPIGKTAWGNCISQ